MSALEDLTPDRRAVLQLLVARGRGYDEIAQLLSLPEIVVRRRAHDAVRELAGPSAGAVADQERALLSDYLLGELPASRRSEARRVLAERPDARRFARAAAARLSGIPGAQLPELPDEDEEVAEALDALDARQRRRQEVADSSTRGAWLLGISVVLVIAAVIIGLVGFSGDDGGSGGASVTNDGSTSTDTATNAASDDYVAELSPPGGGQATGLAALRPQANGAVAFALDASGLPERRTLDGGGFTAYAFWLTGENVEPRRIGFYDDSQEQGSTEPGSLRIGIELNGVGVPAVSVDELSRFDQVVVSLETLQNADARPTEPTDVLLRGDLEARPRG